MKLILRTNKQVVRLDTTKRALRLSTTVKRLQLGAGYPDYALALANVVRAETAAGAAEQAAVSAESERAAVELLHAEVMVASAGGLTADALTVNRGKNYPLRQMVRDGITSIASPEFNNLLLKIRVIGAREGYYYRIGYLQNERNTGTPPPDFGWIVQECPILNYETASSFATVVGYDDPAPEIDRNGGIQTIIVESPDVAGLQFVITLDADQLPPAGTHIVSYGANNTKAWSWIIDTSCYEFASDNDENSLTINQGDNYPLRPMTRDGILSDAPPALLAALLKVEVKGGREGYYYAIRYFQNGSTGADGWDIEESPIADFETASTATRVIRYTDAAPAIPRNGDIETVHLVSTRLAGLELYITLDTASLPAYGTAVQAGYSGSDRVGWSWVIDPSCVEHLPEITTPAPWHEPLYLDVDVDAKTVKFTFAQNATTMFRITIAASTYNGLPTVTYIESAPLGDPAFAVWDLIAGALPPITSADWWPPLVVEATTNGDGGAVIYTGGNHGIAGDDSGGFTARLTEWNVFVDGRQLAAGETYTGSGQVVSLRWNNELMAYNTTSFGRYVLDQTFVANLYPGGIESYCKVTAKESINLRSDNGPQMGSTGYRDSIHYLNGVLQNRGPWVDGDSGSKSLAPNAWAVDTASVANGHQISWIDDTYGLVLGRPYVDSAAACVRLGTSKFYHAVIAAAVLPMTAGDTYEWRGGYAWSAPDRASGTVDVAFPLRKAGAEYLAYATIDDGEGAIAFTPDYVGRQLSIGTIDTTGLAVVSAGYLVNAIPAGGIETAIATHAATLHLTAPQQAAANAANAPSGANPFATKADLASKIYHPESVAVTAGTPVSGDVSALETAGDGLLLLVNEVVGVGLTVKATFTDVENFNLVSIRSRYAGGAGHQWQFRLYNNLLGAMETISTDIGSESALTWHNFAIPNAANYINAGVVEVEFYHLPAFINGHQWSADFVGLVQSSGGATEFPASKIKVDASGFNGNLATTDTDLQKVAQKVDDLVISGGSTDQLVLNVSPTSGNSYTTSTLPALAADERFFVSAIVKGNLTTALLLQLNGKTAYTDYSASGAPTGSTVNNINDITNAENFVLTTGVNRVFGYLEMIDGAPHGFFTYIQTDGTNGAVRMHRITAGKLKSVEEMSTLTFKLFGPATFIAGSTLRMWKVKR